MAISTGYTFGLALCRHFNLPANQVAGCVKVNTGRDEIFGVTLSIALTAEDLMYIGRFMKETK